MSFTRPILIVEIIMSFALVVTAQTTQRQPAKPIRPFVVTPAQSLADVQKKVQSANKAEDLIGGAGMELRVAVQHEKDTAAANAEVHDQSDDVYYVLEGTATLTLGGTLENPKEIEPGEWRAPKIVGGQEVKISKGDLIVVPRGTPHHRSTVGQDFTMLLIKVWEDPRPAVPTQPSPTTPKP